MITAKLHSLAAQGLRTVAVATKTCATPGDALALGDEADLIFERFYIPRSIGSGWPALPRQQIASCMELVQRHERLVERVRKPGKSFFI
jgi:hypothetical protein